MKAIIKKIKRHHIKQVIVYGVVGVAALLVQVVLYFILCRLSVNPLYANFIGNGMGVIVGYKGHTKFTFERTHKFSQKEFIKYVVTALIGLAINSISVYVLVTLLKYHSDVGLIPMFITPGITFLISKFWAFK